MNSTITLRSFFHSRLYSLDLLAGFSQNVTVQTGHASVAFPIFLFFPCILNSFPRTEYFRGSLRANASKKFGNDPDVFFLAILQVGNGLEAGTGSTGISSYCWKTHKASQE